MKKILPVTFLNTSNNGKILSLFITVVCALCSVTSDSLCTPWTVVHKVSLSVEFSRQ